MGSDPTKSKGYTPDNMGKVAAFKNANVEFCPDCNNLLDQHGNCYACTKGFKPDNYNHGVD